MGLKHRILTFARTAAKGSRCTLVGLKLPDLPKRRDLLAFQMPPCEVEALTCEKLEGAAKTCSRCTFVGLKHAAAGGEEHGDGRFRCTLVGLKLRAS